MFNPVPCVSSSYFDLQWNVVIQLVILGLFLHSLNISKKCNVHSN